MINLFVSKEALASCAVDSGAETLCEGLTKNPKLGKLGVQVRRRADGKIVWRGPISEVTRRLQWQ